MIAWFLGGLMRLLAGAVKRGNKENARGYVYTISSAHLQPPHRYVWVFFLEPGVVCENANGTRLVTITRRGDEAVGNGGLKFDVSLKDVAVGNARK
jgi:hypothetical protein